MGLFDSWSVKDEKFILSDNRAYNGGLHPHLYLAGQVVSGEYKFSVTSKISFRSLSLKVSCREYTTYECGENTYCESRNIFKSYIVLLGMCKRSLAEKGRETSAQKGWSSELPVGEYSFPFAFRLPFDAPPTAFVMMSYVFTSSVEYQIKAHFDIPFGADKEAKVNFAVQQPMPAAQRQASISAGPFTVGPLSARRVCCYCCDRGTTEVSMTIDRRAVIFGADASMRGSVTVDNSNSSASLNEVEVAFVERGVFGIFECKQMMRTFRKLIKRTYPTNLSPGGGPQTVQFDLDLSRLKPDQQRLFEQYPYKHLAVTRANTRFLTYDAPMGLASSYSGASMTFYYCVEVSCGGDVLASIVVPCSSFVDASNSCAPIVVSESGATGRLQPIPQGGHYNKYSYAPPPGCTTHVLPRAVVEARGALGPLPSVSPLPPLPYINGAHEIALGNCSQRSANATTCASSGETRPLVEQQGYPLIAKEKGISNTAPYGATSDEVLPGLPPPPTTVRAKDNREPRDSGHEKPLLSR